MEAASLCVPDETYVLNGFFPCSVDPSLVAMPFPPKLEEWLKPFDDPIIAFVQCPLNHARFRGAFVFIARVISALFASSEIGFAIPLFILLLERLDSLAILSA
jgi:hypothetical protein